MILSQQRAASAETLTCVHNSLLFLQLSTHRCVYMKAYMLSKW